MEGVGTLQPNSLGTGDKCPHPPKISEFCLGLGWGTKVFYPPQPDYNRFKIPSFTSPGHTHSPVCALSAELLVIRYHLDNLCREQLILCVFPILHHRIYSQ